MINVFKLAKLPALPRLASPTARLAVTPAASRTLAPKLVASRAGLGLADRLALAEILRGRRPPAPAPVDTTASLVRQARRELHEVRSAAEQEELQRLKDAVDQFAAALED